MFSSLVYLGVRNIVSQLTRVHRGIIWLWLVKTVRHRNQQLDYNKIKS